MYTVYRNINTLHHQGADIRGVAGTGYVLRQDFLLPPPTFNQNEVEALVFGVRWVMTHGDHTLAEAAQSALAKIDAVLPPALAGSLNQQCLYPRWVAENTTHSNRRFWTLRAKHCGANTGCTSVIPMPMANTANALSDR